MKFFVNSIRYGEILGKSIINESRFKPLTRYCAVPYFNTIIAQKDAILFETTLKNGTLGITEADELGVSIALHKNIENENRKHFTLAHEIGHLLMHVSATKTQVSFLENDFTLSWEEDIKKNIRETEANIFAAHLLLPDIVLKNQLLSCMNPYHIKRISKVSIEFIKWRIVNFLKDYYMLDEITSIRIAENYVITTKNKDVANTYLYNLIKGDPSIYPLKRYLY